MLDAFESIDPRTIQTASPFSDLFPDVPSVSAAIEASMRSDGFDPSKPVIGWRQRRILLDGHTRTRAAIAADVEAVPVVWKDFADEDAALVYAIACQRDRRNLTDADLLRCIEAVDQRQDRGGDHASPEGKAKASSEAIGKSADRTAAIVGTSRAKVEKARKVLDAAADNPDLQDAVLTGEKSINAAANEVAARQRPEAPAKPTELAALERGGYVAPGGKFEVDPEPEAGDDTTDSPEVQPANLSPEAWLETLEVRQQLHPRVRRHFDIEALGVYELDEIRREFIDKARPVTARMKATGNGRIGPWMTEHFYYVMLEDPSRWLACTECRDDDGLSTGQVSLIGACAACHGDGYHVPTGQPRRKRRRSA